MTYEELLRDVDCAGVPPAGEAQGVVQDSRKVKKGAVFVCIKGRGFDGHAFAQKALDAGAGMVVTEHRLGLRDEVVARDTRAAYAQMSQNYFGRPAEKLTLVGVTGTNGKTTVASVLKQVLELNGIRCGLIGTIRSEIGEVAIPARFTTPEAWDTAALMARMVRAGCTHLVMEASSQALEQGRLSGLSFALGIFTNLTQDHLDYHGGMKQYFEAKKMLFAQCQMALVNLDDPWGRRLMDEAASPVVKSYASERNYADFTAHNIELRADGARFAFLGGDELCPVRFAMPGLFNVYNALAVGAAAVMLGVEAARGAQALGRVRGVLGRSEVLHSGGFVVIRDYAHTADALDKLLASLRPFAGRRLVVVFGCAGSRDAEKRPAMGEAVAKYADVIYLTADNPRSEDVQATMDDALPAIAASGRPFHLQPDRERAVREALEELGDGDVLVLCGKGHEDYQVMDGFTLYLNEGEIVEGWMKAHGM